MHEHISNLGRAVAGLLLGLMLTGCNRVRNWEIAFNNQGSAPASCIVTTGADGKSSAEVKDFTGQKPVTLLAGAGGTVVHSVVVTIKDKELPVAFTPDTKLNAGQHFIITLGGDGKVSTRTE